MKTIQINIEPLDKGYIISINNKEYKTTINEYGAIFIVDKVSPSIKKLILASMNYYVNNICLK